MAKPLQSAFPDLSVVIEDIREDGDDVLVTSHYSGTFANDLDLSSVGMGAIPATGKGIVFPSQRDRVSFDGDQIAEIHNLETGPDAGMAGFIKALGADLG
ncbi:MAG: ester cyclase [Anaerolineae bacterium]|nr:ester cyclase [Anaerolineae bacterium]